MANKTPPELLYRVALTLIPNIGPALAKVLLAYCGSAEAVFKAPKAKLLKVPGIGEDRAQFIVQSKVLHEAEHEVKFMEKYAITPLFFTDKEYPSRLKECADSPLLLYYKGNADLNTEKVLGIVGTRRATDYGKEMVKKITSSLAAQNILIVSGLAYGIDIAAHQAALEHQLKTVAVLGHGLNTIYPQAHKTTAQKMIAQGGLLSEYRSTEKMSIYNFPNRNRIVAGLCDALLVIESAEDGGAILTANIAGTYNREVMAVPGKVIDKWSKGCNQLIKTNRAQLIESGEEVMKSMNWNIESSNTKSRKPQRELLLNLSEEERKIYDALKEVSDMEIDALAQKTTISTGVLAAILLEMEMKDWIVTLPGKRFKLF